MSDAPRTTRGRKRKSSDAVESSDSKKEKVVHIGPTNATEKLFANDQCIRSILAYLSLEDLANVARASHFLNMNALVVFKTVHDASIKIQYEMDCFAEKQIVFRQFGSLAAKVTVSSVAIDDEADLFDSAGCDVLATIGHFCGKNLNELALGRIIIDISPKSNGFTAKNLAEVRKVLGTLSKLSLLKVCLKSRFFEYLQSLQELNIHACCHMEDIPQVVTLPQLTVVSIGACPPWPFVPRDNFNQFLRANPSIERMEYQFFIMGDGHLEAIRSLPRLTHLELYMTEGGKNEIDVLRGMRKLKKLKVFVDPYKRDHFSQLLIKTSTEVEIEDLFTIVPIVEHHH